MSKKELTFALVPGSISAFFLIVYYGTSFETTPFLFFIPWLFRRRKKPQRDDADDLKADDSIDDIFVLSSSAAAKLASKMERRINTHLILGVALGMLGVSVWLVVWVNSNSEEAFRSRVIERQEMVMQQLRDQARELNRAQDNSDRFPREAYPLRQQQSRLNDEVASLSEQLKLEQSLRPPTGTVIANHIMALLPRLTILIFIEILAGFFLRQYRIGVEDLKYFLELERKAKARRIAYSIFQESKDSDAVKKFANALLQEESASILRAGETTPTIAAMNAEDNPAIKALTIIGEQLTNITKLAKK
jgi:hypothetical protein